MKKLLVIIILILISFSIVQALCPPDNDPNILKNIRKDLGSGVDNIPKKVVKTTIPPTNTFDLTLKNAGINLDQMPVWAKAIKNNPKLADEYFKSINAALAAKDYNRALKEIDNLLKDSRLAGNDMRIYRDELNILRTNVKDLEFKARTIPTAAQAHGGSLSAYQGEGYKILPVPAANKIILKLGGTTKEFRIAGTSYITSDSAILRVKISENVDEFILMENGGIDVTILSKSGLLNGPYGKLGYVFKTTNIDTTVLKNNKIIKIIKPPINVPEYTIKLE